MKRLSKLSFLLAAAMALPLLAVAQYDTPIALSARSGALGGSLFYQPDAALASLGYRSGYLLTAMADKSLQLQLPFGKRGTALAAYVHHGDAAWHEQQAVAAYGMWVAEWLHVAVAARWMHRGVDDVHYRSTQWLAPSAVVRASWQHSSLTLLAGSRPWDDAHPWRLHLQASYRPLPRWLAVVELEREECTRLRMGVEYGFDASWFLRAGLATQPLLLTFGAGGRWKNYSADLAVGVHSALGITPQTSLSLWF